MSFADFQEALLIVAGSGIATVVLFALAGTVLLSGMLVILALVRRMLGKFD